MTKWRKMNSAPMDGTPILVGRWVKADPFDEQSEQRWEQYVISLKSEQMPFRLGQHDFDAWTVIPKPPHWGKE